MNLAQFKDHVSHMSLAGATLSLTGDIRFEPFYCRANISVTKFSEIRWKHLGKTQILRMHIVYEHVFFILVSQSATNCKSPFQVDHLQQR